MLVSFPEAGGNGEQGSMDWFDTDLPHVEYVLLLACSFIWIQHQVAVSSIKLPVGFWVYFSQFQILNAPHLTQANNSSNNTQQCNWSLKSICTVFVCICFPTLTSPDASSTMRYCAASSGRAWSSITSNFPSSTLAVRTQNVQS